MPAARLLPQDPNCASSSRQSPSAQVLQPAKEAGRSEPECAGAAAAWRLLEAASWALVKTEVAAACLRPCRVPVFSWSCLRAARALTRSCPLYGMWRALTRVIRRQPLYDGSRYTAPAVIRRQRRGSMLEQAALKRGLSRSHDQQGAWLRRWRVAASPGHGKESRTEPDSSRA